MIINKQYCTCKGSLYYEKGLICDDYGLFGRLSKHVRKNKTSEYNRIKRRSNL